MSREVTSNVLGFTVDPYATASPRHLEPVHQNVKTTRIPVQDSVPSGGSKLTTKLSEASRWPKEVLSLLSTMSDMITKQSESLQAQQDRLEQLEKTLLSRFEETHDLLTDMRTENLEIREHVILASSRRHELDVQNQSEGYKKTAVQVTVVADKRPFDPRAQPGPYTMLTKGMARTQDVVRAPAMSAADPGPSRSPATSARDLLPTQRPLVSGSITLHDIEGQRNREPRSLLEIPPGEALLPDDSM